MTFNTSGSTDWVPPARVTSVDYLVTGIGGETWISAGANEGDGGGFGGVPDGNSLPMVGPHAVAAGAGSSAGFT